MAPTTEPLPLTLAVKLGSLARHVQEGESEHGSVFDFAAAHALAHDPEVVAWLDSLDPALLPERRA